MSLQRVGAVRPGIVKLWIALLLLAGCASPGGLFGEAVGEKFKKALANVDAYCKKNKMGPYLDRNDPESWRRAAVTDCEILKVKPFDLNAVLATPEGKFAYSIQLPAPLDKPRVKRTDYRSAEEYFRALCEKEAGDHIFAAAENVDRIRQMRASPLSGEYSLGSYSREGLFMAAYPDPGSMFVAPVMNLYSFLEVPESVSKGDSVTRAGYRLFYRDPGVQQSAPVYGVNSRSIEQPTARYAFIWRGVEQHEARDLGIIGGELIILDLGNMSVMAVRRDFSIYTVNLNISDRVEFFSKGCRVTSEESVNFITRVLKPAR